MADKLHVDWIAAKSQLLFVNLNDWVLILDKAKCLNFGKNETLIQQGKQPDLIFMIMDGRAKITNGLGVIIARIGPGEICGEMAFLENTRASATVIAEDAMIVYGVAWPLMSGGQNEADSFADIASDGRLVDVFPIWWTSSDFWSYRTGSFWQPLVGGRKNRYVASGC